MSLPRAVVPTWRKWIPSWARIAIFLGGPLSVSLLVLAVFGVRGCLRDSAREDREARIRHELLGRRYLQHTGTADVECYDSDRCGGTQIRCVAYAKDHAPVEVTCNFNKCKIGTEPP